MLLSCVVLMVGTGLNILFIMYLWPDTAAGAELWTIQMMLPALLYRMAIVYLGRTDMTRARLFQAILTPLLSILWMDWYRIYAYDLGFGRSFQALNGFLPYLWREPMVFLKIWVRDMYNRWWVASLYIFAIIISVIIHYPSEVRAFFEHLKKKFTLKRK